jgi:sterol desaturase/sphingolipid hydroxylase (fatty acid hydroxylase superfamily)
MRALGLPFPNKAAPVVRFRTSGGRLFFLSLCAERSFTGDSAQMCRFEGGNVETAIRYGFYPTMLVINSAVMFIAVTRGGVTTGAFGWLGGFNALTMLMVELLYPMRDEWRMTLRLFVRNLKWTALTLLTINMVRVLFLDVAIHLQSARARVLSPMPIVLEALLMALTFELFQYWFHRWSHEGKGVVGAWLWKVHVAHHLPKEVHLLMHPISHPINTVVIQLLLQGSFALLGHPQSIFVFYSLVGLHELFSHFNVDIRAGWLNYLFVGTELHRHHHSARTSEAKNYGTVISLWDLIFGTLRYTPGSAPAALGVAEPSAYPPSEAVLGVLALPFVSDVETPRRPGRQA